MKRFKFITGLSAAFISAIALMSCSQIVRGKTGVVLTINGVDYTAEDLFNDQKTPAGAEAKFNAIYKVAVRNYFETTPEGASLKDEISKEADIRLNAQKAKAQSEASKSGTKYADEWQKILDANGCKDEAELLSKLEYDVQKEKFEEKLYEHKWTEGTINKTNYDVLRNGGKLRNEEGKGFGQIIGEDKTAHPKGQGYLSLKQPYHMKHIFVKLGTSETDNVTGTITEDEAQKIYNVVTSLARGENFETVSKDYNDDKTAKDNHASLGIMSRDTSFVSDFKLGTYFYDAFVGSSTSKIDTTYDSKEARKELKLDDATVSGSAAQYAKNISKLIDPTTGTSSSGEGFGIGQIPYEAILALGKNDYEDPNPDKKGSFKPGLGSFKYTTNPVLSQVISSSDFKDKFLPRNIIYNKYFNKHNIMIITPTTLPDYGDKYPKSGSKKAIYSGSDSTSTTYLKERGNGSVRKLKDNYSFGSNNDYENLPGFAVNAKNADQVTINSIKRKPLRDNNGRVILVFRSKSSEDGIHFAVIERSPFIGHEFDSKTDDVNYKTTLDEYYTQYYPGQTGGEHPTYPIGAGKDYGKNKRTYVNFIDEDESGSKAYKTRSDTVKTELKKCVFDLDKYVYSYLTDTDSKIIEFNTKIKEVKATVDEINDWININRGDEKNKTDKKWNDEWQKYYYSLSAKEEIRSEKGAEQSAEGITSELIPEVCISVLTQFKDASDVTALSHLFGVGGVFHE